LAARRGSTHGYDVMDHETLNPELGDMDSFRHMAEAFRGQGIGIVLDIVPNHMGVGGDQNRLWLDVLEWGRASRYGDWFDINWSPSERSLAGKVLVPFLGEAYGDAIANGSLQLKFDAKCGEIAVWIADSHKLPLAPPTYALVLGGTNGMADLADAFRAVARNEFDDASGLKQRLAGGDPAGVEAAVAAINADADRLHEVISQQHWRPARYSVAADDINYRRFFIVSDLAGIRVERDDVFEYVHRIPLQLVADGLVDGLRVDHIDGLYDPKAYCVRLRAAAPRPIYLVVEKILAPHESLRADWQVDGTTGYEFATAVTQLLTDPAGEAELSRTYEAVAGPQPSLAEMERRAKLDIIDFEMAAELDALTERLHRLALASRKTIDITRNALRAALRQYVGALGVYRTYVDDGELSGIDLRNMEVALVEARRVPLKLDPAVFDFLTRVVTGELCRVDQDYPEAEVREAARRLQQYTGPVMAKGLEDTTLYRYNRLIALSDVGQRPDRFTRSIEAFHDFNRARVEAFPRGMLTSSSHDTKRGEDVRARIAVLSGMAPEWTAAAAEWQALLSAAGAPEIDGNDRHYFFQLLLGAWPAEISPAGEIAGDALEVFRTRTASAMLKSVREARQRTNWAVPRSDYEQQVSRYVAMGLGPGSEFLSSFRAFQRQVGPLGASNGLIATALKLTVPGVPDIYQGAEFWEESMVDPDNRRPVDFAARAAGLASSDGEAALTANWRNGRIKQRLIRDLLHVRKERPELFAAGSYEPVSVDDADGSTLAFLRRCRGDALLVVVRLYPWRSRPWEPVTVSASALSKLSAWRRVAGDVSVGAGGVVARFDTLPVAVAVAKAG
jgi:(1->4)-alpha-D-glucan 1-alpha-D-glucosylmutase